MFYLFEVFGVRILTSESDQTCTKMSGMSSYSESEDEKVFDGNLMINISHCAVS